MQPRLISISAHVLLVALFFTGFNAVHRVERQKNVEQLIFPAEHLKPIRTVKAPGSTQLTVARLAVAAPSTLRVTRAKEAQQPAPAALSNPGFIPLPSSTVRVVESTQAVVGTFNNPEAGSVSSHSAGSVSTAGFGATTGSQGTQHSGGGRVVAAGFNLTQEPATGLRAATTLIAQAPTRPVITYEPAKVVADSGGTEDERRARTP
jgi:hypothetical protein